jgi:hypothetical protein
MSSGQRNPWPLATARTFSVRTDRSVVRSGGKVGWAATLRSAEHSPEKSASKEYGDRRCPLHGENRDARRRSSCGYEAGLAGAEGAFLFGGRGRTWSRCPFVEAVVTKDGSDVRDPASCRRAPSHGGHNLGNEVTGNQRGIKKNAAKRQDGCSVSNPVRCPPMHGSS